MDSKDEYLEVEPIAGKLEAELDLMWQLEKLTTKELATKWFGEYIAHHGTSTSVYNNLRYMIGYFAETRHTANLIEWFFN